MHDLVPQHLERRPVWSSAVWLAVLLSPTGYVLLVILLGQLRTFAPPGWLVVALFFVVPAVALLICGNMVLSNVRGGRRVVWLVLTVLAMLLQVAALVLIIVSAITVAISPA